jgi:excisionase family DNA binding protein
MAKFINSVELAARLGVAARTVRDWTGKGWIPHYRFGDLLRYNYAEIVSHLHKPATKEATPYDESRRSPFRRKNSDFRCPGQTTIGATQLDLPKSRSWDDLEAEEK